MNHIIVCRVNLHMDLDPSKYGVTQQYKQPGFDQDRLNLLNKYARPSIARQKKDVFFVTLWQKGHLFSDGMLKNEIPIEIERTGTGDDEPLDYRALGSGSSGKRELNYSDQIADKLSQYFNAPLLIGTLDVDDCLHKNFLSVLHRQIERTDFDYLSPFWWSTETRYLYDPRTGATGQKKRDSPSPFVTVWEPGPIQAYAVRYNHSYLHFEIKNGMNVKGLFGLQIVHGNNMFSKRVGDPAKIKLKEFL
ncbi:MAG: hypothetical protein ACOCTU_07350 [Bacteroidota bacterium]